MKPLLVLILSLLAFPVSAQDAKTPPAAKPTIREDKSLPKLDLKNKLPEDFDWPAWFGESGDSTGERWAACYKAHEVLKARMDEVCAELRKKLSARGSEKALAAFDKMQKLWQDAAEAEIAFVALEYEGGSEAKVSRASHRYQLYLRRVHELKALGQTAHFYE